MSKRVVIPTRASPDQSNDQWIQQAAESGEKTSGLRRKRLTIDMDQNLHRSLIIHCVTTDQEIASLVRRLIRTALSPEEEN